VAADRAEADRVTVGASARAGLAAEVAAGPGRLSITTGWPSALLISVPTSRATVSEVPAEKGTITRTGWVG
jgi:hypothetical protein